MRAIYNKSILISILILFEIGLALGHASAEVVTFEFDAVLQSGPLAGTTFSGNASYEAEGLTGVGTEFQPLTSLTFTLLGVRFTEADILQGGQAILQNGVLSDFTAAFFPSEPPVDAIAFGFGGPGVIGYQLGSDFGSGVFTLITDVSRSVFTQHNDSMRTGAYLVERDLTPITVNSATGPGMALRYERPVDGDLRAQLLYVRGVQIGSRKKNVIYAFTSNNIVYAYDADEERDSGTMRGLIWPPTHFPVTAELPLPGFALATPVIDASRHTLFVVYSISNGLLPMYDVGDGNYEAEFHLAALDIRSGKVLRDVVVCEAHCSVPSSVPPYHADFDARHQIQRAGLLLAPNPIEPGRWNVYVAFGARHHEESINYHGWVMAYDAETFAPRGVFCSTPNRRDVNEGGGIWQWGSGLAADEDGNVYFSTGNGVYSKRAQPTLAGSGNDHGNSFVKLTPVRADGAYDFDVVGFSAAADDSAHASEWEQNDIDLGAGGVTLIPGTSQFVGGGKTGVLYLMNRDTMRKTQDPFEAFDNTYDPCPHSSCTRYSNTLPKYDGSWMSGPHLHPAPTYWKVSPEEGFVFDWSEKDRLKRWPHFRQSGVIATDSVLLGDDPKAQDYLMPGGRISLSADGPLNGILWITLPWGSTDGKILAYDAQSLHKLWDFPVPFPLSRDNPPTVADGRVIVGTGVNKFLVYRLAQPGIRLPLGILLPIPEIDPFSSIRQLLALLSDALRRLITPPQGHRPYSLALGRGALTYEARTSPHGTKIEWALVGARGELRDQSGVMPNMGYEGYGMVLATAKHGFVWTDPDGSQMSWSVKASVPAPQTGNAPWVLFRSRGSPQPEHNSKSEPEHAGDGGRLLRAITYVQQIATQGGAPPAGNGAHIGQRVQVPYTAVYAFYVEAENEEDKAEQP
jgi:outer membrane protein assembly factor BamB